MEKNFSLETQRAILNKLAFRSKKKPHIRTCKSKLAYGFAILNSLSENMTCENVDFAYKIIEKLETYLQDVESRSRLDKYILQICNKHFIPGLFDMVSTESKDPNVSVAKEIVALKVGSKCNTEALERSLPYASERLQVKAREALRRSVRNKETQLNADFEGYLSESFVWNDFSAYKSSSSLEAIPFIDGIEALECNLLRKAKRILWVHLQRKTYLPHLYNLLALIHFLLLEYHESKYYIIKGLECGVGRRYFLEAMLYVERIAGIYGPSPVLSIKHPPQTANLQEIFENKFLLQRYLKTTSPYRNVLFFEKFVCEEVFMRRIEELQIAHSVIVVFFYVSDNVLYFWSTSKTAVICDNWKGIEEEFEEIMADNRSVLCMSVGSDEDKKKWWATRTLLDKKLERLMRSMSSGHERFERVTLVLDESTIKLPFELLFDCPATRVFSIEIPERRSKVPPSKAFYLLDALNNLHSTRERIKSFFETRPLPCNIQGIVGRELTVEEKALATKSDLFMYFGHGSGRKYITFDRKHLLPHLLFLFGCSSGRLLSIPNFMPNGVALSYIRQKRVVLGMLWDVTDKDIDRLTVGFLERFFRGSDPGSALFESRKLCRLRYLNGAAAVVYGV